MLETLENKPVKNLPRNVSSRMCVGETSQMKNAFKLIDCQFTRKGSMFLFEPQLSWKTSRNY